MAVLIECEKEIKLTGSHYTPKNLADFVARQIISVSKDIYEKEDFIILDPGIGDGELIISLIKALFEQRAYNFHVCGFDTNEKAVQFTEERLKELILPQKTNIKKYDFLKYIKENFSIEDDLFTHDEPEKVDLIISNPPYIRTQNLGANKSQELAKDFGLNGKIDIYHSFIYGISTILNPGGIAGIIVSNRFMTTKSGELVREKIIEDFDILHIWDMGDTRFFKAAVLPAVLLLRKKKENITQNYPKFTSIYSIDKPTDKNSVYIQCPTVIEALNNDGIVSVNNEIYFMVKNGNLENYNNPNKVWCISTDKTQGWLEIVKNNTSYSFEDIGKIKVGVKTTADNVFIRKDWKEMKESIPELLLPLTTHHIAGRYRPSCETKDINYKILYPHINAQGKCKPVDIDNYPNSCRYLNLHKDQLINRKYVIDAGRKWYEIWVPHNPEIWNQAKVIFRDIADQPTFWIDLDGTVVNGDCYWITYQNENHKDLLWLIMAIGNSTFIETFYDVLFHNKLYANRRRFMTQYVAKFPIPDPQLPLSKKIISLSKEVYSKKLYINTNLLENEIDQHVWNVFGLSYKEIPW